MQKKKYKFSVNDGVTIIDDSSKKLGIVQSVNGRLIHWYSVKFDKELKNLREDEIEMVIFDAH